MHRLTLKLHYYQASAVMSTIHRKYFNIVDVFVISLVQGDSKVSVCLEESTAISRGEPTYGYKRWKSEVGQGHTVT
jgi:hypothetical protein